ncbi:hypothetical protein [Psychrobacillus soli]|uniref:Uncharacterized protein n=1 Tax=Psychrobacillus soli TaxID=1543965 RepID=A0A544TB92_9BACI|nr:hypothetical protein [Psychrobacillus soli]TQR14734.1 hypothetical protein FG383_10460 [Psychrobacillus soli]
MNQELLEKKLRSIGKEIFVEYFEEFRDLNVDREELSKKLLKDNPKAISLDAQKTRISNARKIFELKMEKEALENIVKSDRLKDNIREKAKRIANTIINV